MQLENVPRASSSYKLAGGGLLSTVGDLVQVGHVLLYSYQIDDLRSRMARLSSGGNETSSSCLLPDGYISSSTLRELWSPMTLTSSTIGEYTRAPEARSALERRTKPIKGYALGWSVKESGDPPFGCTSNTSSSVPFFVYHTGLAVGASSVLLIAPFDEKLGSACSFSNDDLSTFFESFDFDRLDSRISYHSCQFCKQSHELTMKGVVVAIMCNLQNVVLWPLAHQIALEFIALLKLANFSKSLN